MTELTREDAKLIDKGLDRLNGDEYAAFEKHFNFYSGFLHNYEEGNLERYAKGHRFFVDGDEDLTLGLHPNHYTEIREPNRKIDPIKALTSGGLLTEVEVRPSEFSSVEPYRAKLCGVGLKDGEALVIVSDERGRNIVQTSSIYFPKDSQLIEAWLADEE